MKLRLMILVLACLLLLSGCGQDAQSGDPRPAGEPSPAQAADTPFPEVSQPAEPVVDRPDVTGEWYRTGCHSECSATVVISEQTAGGFTVKANCNYGAHMGYLPETDARFTGETAGVMEVYGDYEYRTETGPKPPVEFTWDGDTMAITTEATDLDLGFGVNVYIHGTYTRGEPEYTNAGQLDRLLSPEEQERLQAVAGENYNWNVAQVLGNGTVETDIPCLLADGRRARYLSASYTPNWGYTLEAVLAEDGRTYCTGNGGWLCTDDPNAAELPEVAWPVQDDTHDFFTVPTGGKLGTLLVTVEQQGEETADGLYRCTFSVWDPAGLTEPVQAFEVDATLPLSWHDLIDANFDGHMDFCYAYYSGAANATFGLYLWDEELGQFALTETFFGMGLWADEEAQTLETWSRLSAGMTSQEKYRWENGKLVHFQSTYPDEEWKEYVTYELVDGEMVEVSRGPIFMEDQEGGDGINEA